MTKLREYLGEKQVARSTFEELRDFDTALLANTIGNIDSTSPEEYYLGGSIRSLTPALGPTVGIAVTCELDSSTPGNQSDDEVYWQQLEEMDSLDLPIVWVVRTVGSRPDHECVIGDGMAKTLHSVGCVGLVTNGGVRDLKGTMTVPFAVYGRSVTIHHVALRFRAPYQPVEIGGIRIQTGDVIHADNEGVIKIPTSCLDKLAGAAVLMRAFEHEVHIMWRRTDLSPTEKRRLTRELVGKYDFRNCCVVARK